MDYASEIESPTRQINNSVLAAVPTPNYQGSIQNLVPFEQQREQTIHHLTHDYDVHTNEMIQTKEQTDLVNQTSRQLKNIQGKNTALKTKIESEKKELAEAKKELQLQMSKQKVVFDLFIVFGATIVVYLLFRSFESVHIIALVVLIAGIVYVLQYNAYRIRIFGDDNSSAIFPDAGSHRNSNEWWKTSVSSLVSTTTPSLDYSKWMSTT